MPSKISKQSNPTDKSNNENAINAMASQSIKYHSHKNQVRPRKNQTLQWSITSLESHQIVNCDAFTLKVIM